MKPVLDKLSMMVDELKSTSSSLDKVQIIKNYCEDDFSLQQILKFTYDPYLQFHVTSKSCKKQSFDTIEDCVYNNIFDVLIGLNKRMYTGHAAIRLIQGHINLYPQHEELIYNIIDKDLKTRTGVTLINKAISGLIPEFKVALAKEYDGKCDFEHDTWFASRKLDGVRCLAIVDDEGKCRLYSRQGKEFTTLNKVRDAIEARGIKDIVLDGEICIMDEDGNENFQDVMKEIRRKDHTIDNPRFVMFDYLTKNEFERTTASLPLRIRLNTLKSYVKEGNPILNETERIVAQEEFHDAEYTVVDVDFNTMSVVRDGKECQETMLAQVYIEHKGYKVKVGSGFTQEQRIKYLTEDIVGKTITVQYFEETHTDKGGISLRFPTVKHIYNNERDC